MKAIVQKKYGGSEALQLKDVQKPVPKEREVLIKVHAAAINDYDWSMMRGKPYIYRLMFGLIEPKNKIPGMELSGTVVALGENVTKFELGDAVYGDISGYGFGAFAEFTCVNEQALVRKPPQMSFEEAASVPHASMLVLQGLVDVGKIRENQKVLINGAGGGVGTFGLYIAKLYGAEVTGVDTGDKLEMISSIGYDQVIDYKDSDFTKNGQLYDLILDTKTNRSPFEYIRCLSEEGRYVTVGGELSRILQIVLLKHWIAKFHGKSMAVVGLKPNKDLDYIHELYEAVKIKPVIDGPYELSQAPELVQYFGEGKHTGKVILSLTT
jgi:NADPH:quinone reductase-like Zn-dependent oxidoreductase